MSRAFKSIYRVKNPQKYINKNRLDNIISRSSWERGVMIWCDNSAKVIAWGSEEVIVPYINKVDGKQHRYYIDFYIKTSDKKEYLIEVKPWIQTQAPEQGPKKSKKRLLNEVITYTTNTSKWEAATRYADKINAKFLIWTEKELNAMGIPTVTSKPFKMIQSKKKISKIPAMKAPKYKKTIGKFDGPKK